MKIINRNIVVSKPKHIFRLSIRTIIITMFLVQVLVVAFTTAYISFKINAKSAATLVDNTIYELNSKIQNQISSYFETPAALNEMNDKLIHENLINVENQADLLKQFSIEIKSHSSVNSISFANKSGGLANAGIDKEKKKYYVIYTDKFRSGTFYKFALNEKNEKSALVTSIPFFDARTRPWYVKAQSNTGIVWSDVYLIATGNDLGINASKSVRDKDNNFLGVVCVDLFLSDISKFLGKLDLGIGGQAFIIDRTGLLIASSNNDKLFNIDSKNQIKARIKATESESDLIKTASTILKNKYSDFNSITRDIDLTISVNGESYLVHVNPFDVISSHQWLIVTVMPEITFMSQVYANNRITIYLIFAALFLSIILAFLLARMISSPIQKLDKKIRAISQGEWQSEPVPSRISEIDGLAVEIYKMKISMQSTIETLFNEIAERRQAEEFLQNIITNNPISIQIVDNEGFTLQINDANAKLFGLAPPPEFCVFTDPQILGQGQAELLQKAKNGEVVYLPDMYYNVHDFSPDFPDKPIWIKVVIFPILGTDGKPERLVLMHEDITHRKLSENALIAAKDIAEESNRLKSSFLANMSHELRTPLSGILGFSELLKEQLPEGITNEMANMINQSGNRLLNTLNLILDLSQIEANMQEIHSSTFDLNKLLNGVIKLFEPVAAKKELLLKCSTDNPKLFILSDSSMVEHVLNELISNAIKYTTTGSVSVSTRIINNGHDSRIVIEVSDTGIGITPEDQKMIFDPFRQVSEGWNRSFEGTGLGLTICKKYVNLLGGEMILESNFGSGSKFIISFPGEILQKEIKELTKEKTATVQPIIDTKTNITTLPKLLLVDDDETCFVMVSKMLKNIAAIDYVATGSESLSLMKEHVYSLVLLDINLKTGMSGLDVLTEIKKLDNYTGIPIVALTAYAMLDDKEKFLSHGFTGYISKPFTGSDLVDAISKWITN